MYQYLADRSSVETIVSQRRGRASGDRRVDWANQNWAGINVVDTIDTDPKETIGRIIRLTGADIEFGWIRRRQRQCANRKRLRRVENGSPRQASIERTPDTSLRGSQINLI